MALGIGELFLLNKCENWGLWLVVFRDEEMQQKSIIRWTNYLRYGIKRGTFSDMSSKSDRFNLLLLIFSWVFVWKVVEFVLRASDFTSSIWRFFFSFHVYLIELFCLIFIWSRLYVVHGSVSVSAFEILMHLWNLLF